MIIPGRSPLKLDICTMQDFTWHRPSIGFVGLPFYMNGPSSSSFPFERSVALLDAIGVQIVRQVPFSYQNTGEVFFWLFMAGFVSYCPVFICRNLVINQPVALSNQTAVEHFSEHSPFHVNKSLCNKCGLFCY